MDEPPDLSRLSLAEKEQLIRELWLLVRSLTFQVRSLQAKVEELEARLAQNSRHSSKPPSSDVLAKPKPKSLRQTGERPSGGQEGHGGHTLKKVAAPDRIETHLPPSHCADCGAVLAEPTVVETRQVFDLPRLGFEVTEHQGLASRCTCGRISRGTFPTDVAAPVQYGPAQHWPPGFI